MGPDELNAVDEPVRTLILPEPISPPAVATATEPVTSPVVLSPDRKYTLPAFVAPLPAENWTLPPLFETKSPGWNSIFPPARLFSPTVSDIDPDFPSTDFSKTT